ncbi:putative bifunctional diguanylate cyclase/phosphodiesterase [Ideonella sp.]|uniref:putative bifunctional diguanylate cyclase/phosphodiesterase n=1 Tax=Ideonella sp. TaxID=1929293 RepID=UPI003BB6969B
MTPPALASSLASQAIRMPDGPVALAMLVTLTGLGWQLWRWHAQAVRAAADALESRAMLDHSPQLIGLLWPDGRICRFNAVAVKWLGQDQQALAQRPIWEHPIWAGQAAQASRLEEAVRQAASGARQRLDLRISAGPGVMRQIELSLRPVPKGPQQVCAQLLLEARDVTLARQAQDKLKLTGAVFDQAREGLLIADPAGIVLSVNPAFCELTGLGADSVQGQPVHQLNLGSDDRALQRDIRHNLRRTGHWQGEVRACRPSGVPYIAWLSMTCSNGPDGQPGHLIGILNDITRSRQAEQRLLRQAHYDSLTDLPNRSLLADRLNQALVAARRDGESIALLFMDLNQLRDINDNFGHSVGDGVLLEVAQRLRSALREVDTVARLGGDEFAVLLPATRADGAEQVAAKLMERLTQPCHVGSQDLSLTLSMGVAVFPDDADTCDAMIRCADTAMYRAKQEGRGHWCFYTPEMHRRSARQMQLETALRRAEARGELMLHYQPQLDLATGRVVGLEALIRWHHPELGMISPGEFIPLAESSGQILAIGAWVMRTAVRQLKAWLDQGLPPCVVAVNLSAVQFREPDLPLQVQAVLQASGLPAACLELELTESVAAGNPEAACAMMQRLHALGVRLSIDDFGTGFSSLSHLKRFPIHTLKIDQSFVRDIDTDPDDRAIVQAIIQMAKALRLTTIAEGVETAGQAEFLSAQGCDMVQGYLYCRPQAPDQALQWLNARNQPPEASGAAVSSSTGQSRM